MKRAYLEWSTSAAGGKHTAVAAGAETRERRRRLPDELEAMGRHKGDSISHELFQWFLAKREVGQAAAGQYDVVGRGPLPAGGLRLAAAHVRRRVGGGVSSFGSDAGELRRLGEGCAPQ